MKKQGIIGLVVGVTAGVAAAVAGGLCTAKVVKEIKSDLKDNELVSPDGNNVVTLSCGVSSFAKGLALIKVNAKSGEKEDECRFSFLAGKSASGLNYEWKDNDHFELTVGEGKLQQCCDVSFENDEIVIMYFMQKNTPEATVETEKVCEETEAVETENAEENIEE